MIAEPSLFHAAMLSLRIALAATAVASLIGIPLAFWLARRRPIGKAIIETLITVPLVLPPTVVGYILLRALGTQSLIGAWLKRHFDYTILFTEEGAVLAAFVVALPLLYIPAKAAFANVDSEMEDVARLMGANRLQIFWHVSLPFARRGVMAGLMLAFARALGEFGATVMVLGTSPRLRTLPISIYLDLETGNPIGAVLLLTAVSIVVVYVLNRRIV